MSSSKGQDFSAREILALLLMLVLFLALLFAATFSFVIVREPLRGTPDFLLCVIVSVISWTYVLRETARVNREKALETLHAQTARGETIDPALLRDTEIAIPSFWFLLKRHTLIALIAAPLVVLINILAAQSFEALIALGRDSVADRSDFRAVVKLLFAAYALVWLFFMSVIALVLPAWIDKTIFHHALVLPQSEIARLRGSNPDDSSVTARLRDFLKGIASMALMFAKWIVPIGVSFVVILALPIPEQTKIPLITAAMTLISVFSLVSLVGNLGKDTQKIILQTIDEGLEEGLKAAKTPAEREELEKTRAHFARGLEISAANTKSSQRKSAILGGLFATVIIIAIMVNFAAATAGLTKANIAIVTCITLVLGTVAAFMINAKLTPPAPMSKAPALMEGWEASIRRGDYDESLRIVENAMKELPNWETQIPAIATYAQVGRFEEAEKLANELFEMLFLSQFTGSHRPINSILGHTMGLLAEIALYKRDFAQADDLLEKSLTYDTLNAYARPNTMGKRLLYAHKPDEALPYLQQAEAGYLAAKIPVTAYNMALHAWAAAQQGDESAADHLMETAFAQTPPEHLAVLAELFLIQGYTARTLGRVKEAQIAFEHALSHDPKGVSGLLARKELPQ